MSREHQWQARSPRRLSDAMWESMLIRVRAEFEEMPGLRLTLEQARTLLGLPEPAAGWVFERLAKDGFLARHPGGMYLRRQGSA